MGNDGGSIPTRRELVKDAARGPTISELKATALESLLHAWSHCALSGDALDLETAVSDWRGRLYNYEPVLKGLVPSEDPDTNITTPASMGLRSLRDVVKLKFTKNGDKWICPISMKEMGPSTKAVYLVPCGHVFAEIAIKQIAATACPECGEDFSHDNIVAILPTNQDEVDRLAKRMERLRAAGLTHALKKDRSEKKKKRKADDSAQEDKNGQVSSSRSEKSATSNKTKDINNPLAASLAAKVLTEQNERNKKRKLELAQASAKT